MGSPLLWSSDGRRLLSGMEKPDASGRLDRTQTSLWLFEVESDRASGREILDDRGAANSQVAWSPNGELVVIAEMSRIRVLSISKSEVISHREFDLRDIEIDGYPRAGANHPVVFSSDSSSFWIAWPTAHARERFTLALKLDANSLKVVDRCDIDPPVPGNRHEIVYIHLEFASTGPRLVACVDSYTGIKDAFGGDTAHWFFYGVDLTSKTELFPHFQWVEDDAPSRFPGDVLLSPDGSVLLVSIGRAGHTPAVPDTHLERDYEVYQTRTGQRSSFFDTAVTLKGEHYQPKFFGETSEVLITLSGSDPYRPDGLLSLRTSDGVILQRISGPSFRQLAFSVDRKRMAASLQIPNTGIQFFSINL